MTVVIVHTVPDVIMTIIITLRRTQCP